MCFGTGEKKDKKYQPIEQAQQVRQPQYQQQYQQPPLSPPPKWHPNPRLCPTPQNRDGFRIAIICTSERQARAVEAMFDLIYEKDGRYYRKDPKDPNSYITGVMGVHNVVLVRIANTGKVDYAKVATDLQKSFKIIDIAIFVGVCGAPSLSSENMEVFLGDEMMSRIVQKFHGAIYEDGEYDPPPSGLPRKSKPATLSFLKKFHSHRNQGIVSKKIQQYVQSRYQGHAAAPTQPRVHVVTRTNSDVPSKSASYNDYMERTAQVIRSEMRGIDALDGFPVLIIRAACDYADTRQNERFQYHAAITAAACLKVALQYWDLTDVDFKVRR